MSDVIGRMLRDGIVPVYHHSDETVALAVARSCVDAGLGTFEFTNRSDRALGVLEQVVQGTVGSGLVVGVGSITDAAAANRAIEAGASFVVGPTVDHAVAALCVDTGVPYIPGGSTLTELVEGSRLGCGVVKLFPAAHLGGPDYLSAIRAPSPWLQVMPTGGIRPTADSMGPWFSAGAVCVGIGSSLFPEALVVEERWIELTDHVASAVRTVRSVR